MWCGAGPLTGHVRTLLAMVAVGHGDQQDLTGLRSLCKLWDVRNKDEVRDAVHAAGGHVALVDRVLELGPEPGASGGVALQVMQLALRCLVLL